MEQQLLFGFDWDTPPIQDPGDERRTSLPKRKIGEKTLPVFLQNLKDDDADIGTFFAKFNLSTMMVNKKSFAIRKKWISSGYSDFRNVIAKIASDNTRQLDTTIVYFGEDGTMWTNKVHMFFDEDLCCMYGWQSRNFACRDFTMDGWKTPRQTKLMVDVTLLQDNTELLNILQKVNPYSAKWAVEMHIEPQILLMAPHIETLCKAGYEFAKDFHTFNNIKEDACTLFNRLCQVGTKPKNIFKTTKTIYSILKNETNLEIWDCYRRLDKTGKIKSDNVEVIYNQGFDAKDLGYVNSILAKHYNGKPVFTWNTLVNYLGRLDTFEAIERKEAFILLDDYLSMCNQLQMEPRIDGDSLKREHDIAARNCRNMRNEILSKKMTENCEVMKKYNYAENIYFIRAIQSYDDLLDEAKQQHNCVASYGQRIAAGQSYIYVMREVAHPDKSLITIELSPNGKTIRQKFLAYNKPIHNKSQSEFIERWTAFCKKEVKRKEQQEKKKEN